MDINLELPQKKKKPAKKMASRKPGSRKKKPKEPALPAANNDHDQYDLAYLDFKKTVGMYSFISNF